MRSSFVRASTFARILHSRGPPPSEEGSLNATTHGSGPLRIGIVGAGNCASSLVQGLTYYRDAADDAVIPGLMNPRVGRYHVRDVEVACAFDIHEGKVGRDLAEALQCE